MALTMRRVRLWSARLLIVPFLWLARPTVELLVAGAVLAAIGLWIRAMAAGFIHKDRKLTTTGPYARTRNPLYLGTFVLGIGVTLAGGQWWFVAIFVVFFFLVYSKTMRGEAELLTELFGDEYRTYAANVPYFLPRLTAWKQAEAQSAFRFDFDRWKRNREYEALLGAAAGFGFLIARMMLR